MIKYLMLIVIALLTFISPLTQAEVKPTQNFIIDTDVSIDDAMAILYLLQQPHVQVKAITIEGDGNAHCKPAYANVQGLLRLTGNQSIPTACGRPTPLQGAHKFPDAVLADCDTFNGAGFSDKDIKLPAQTAKSLMIKTLEEAKQPINILAIGPLTTIAEVIAEKPKLKAKIRMIYMMGGAIKVPGNIKEVDHSINNQVAEWNIYIDPVAAKQVFNSKIPITLVPLDVTNQAPMDSAFIERMKTQQATPAAKYVNRIFDAYHDQFASGIWYFWDPLAAVVATDESLVKIKQEKLTVLTAPDNKSGATVVDAVHGVPINVCTEINKEAFENKLLNGL